MTKTEDFMVQNVAYRPTVYKIGPWLRVVGTAIRLKKFNLSTSSNLDVAVE